jgi:hypothetical protein
MNMEIRNYQPKDENQHCRILYATDEEQTYEWKLETGQMMSILNV